MGQANEHERGGCVTAMTVACEFARLACEHGDKEFSAMKLQKLLYFAQAWSLHDRGTPMFQERVKAWKDGPVVPNVYYAFRGLKWLDTKDDRFTPTDPCLSSDDREIIAAVWEMYKDSTGDELSDITHRHSGYISARSKSPFDESPAIDQEQMANDMKQMQADAARAVLDFLDTLPTDG